MILGVAARVYPMFLLAPEPRRLDHAAAALGPGLGRPGRGAGPGGGARPARPRARWPWPPPPAATSPGCSRWRAAESGRVSTGVSASRSRPPRSSFPRPSSGLALAADRVAGPRVALAYAVIVLGGWISLTIAGMMLKIVPFLVWYRVYSSAGGSRAGPDARAALSPARRRLWPTRSSPGCRAAGRHGARRGGRLDPAAGAVLALGALVFATALARVLGHLLACGGPGMSRTDSSQSADARGAVRVTVSSASDASRSRGRSGMCLDPELGMSVVDLGLDLRRGDRRQRESAITMTLDRTQGCPLHDVHDRLGPRRPLAKIPGVEDVRGRPSSSTLPGRQTASGATPLR